ncbi:MAG: imidazole glycerol phosphate synthase subunit HisH [Candidatus Omnitrophica bacterium]|jgi:glutamine amidotransferase|nr:imidazole glycerol phosphate synthase subunit HisH [Candidatus Omnitrophota bacterium]
MIGIIDYGMGNIHSVQKALENLGGKTFVTNKPQDIITCEKIVLPGVGAFSDAMQELEKSGMAAVIKQAIKEKKIFLGICLGMQLLFEASEEAGNTPGLGILKGRVKKFVAKKGLKVPQMGWNQLKIKDECLLLKGLSGNPYVYFCHSYYPDPADKRVIAASCDYGNNFAAVVCKDNLYAVQFHPEKSQAVGLKILKNFVNLC